MPPRWMCGIIIGSWLGTIGWLFWHDLLPRWLPGEPPPFHIDDVEEVQKSSGPLRTFWIVERQLKGQAKPRSVFQAATWVDYHKETDEYTLNASLDASKDPKFQPVTVAKLLKIDRLTSTYRVNHPGQLRSLEAKVEVRFINTEEQDTAEHSLRKFFLEQLSLTRNDAPPDPISLCISGEVRDHQFFAHCRADSKYLKKPIQIDLPPVPVSHTGSVLLPLHPVNHIRGLHVGQSWRQPLVDPLRDALPGFSSGVRWLNARVLPHPERLDLNGEETTCLVIEYTNDENEPMGRTWVEEDGERVLQQEALLEGSRWIMRRELTRRSHNRLRELGHD
jgi:hypothetical protein